MKQGNYFLDHLIERPVSWMSDAVNPRIVFSSRIRLARNVRGYTFPDRSDEKQNTALRKHIAEALHSCFEEDDIIQLNMEDISPLDKMLLFERHLISREHTDKGEGSGLLMTADESLAVMINEEDHMRMQVFGPGQCLEGLWKRLDSLDDQIEKLLEYAFFSQYGYVTACPSNVGTGLRAGVMMHLPGLTMMDDIGAVIKGVSKIGLVVRGLWGEGSEAAGNLFQISNQITLGENEAGIVENLQQIVLEIVEHEKNARIRLKEQRLATLKDNVGRAMGILSHAYMISSREALDLLSSLRLGSEMGIVKCRSDFLDGFLMMNQPAHLQRYAGRHLSSRERDVLRAEIIRDQLTHIES